ncbi:hypothetical protein ACM16X_08890 [Haloarcula japonica]|uniref:hypothetical protein n=1 Tax=Haloarcula japonica TaxID=29282 RepID=UPI0039F69CD7
MSDDGYVPLIDREREPEQRVHRELTKPSRERLQLILKSLVGNNELEYGLEKIVKKVGLETLLDTDIAQEVVGNEYFGAVILYSETVYTLNFISFVINRAYEKANQNRFASSMLGYDASDIQNTVEEIENVLITEGILWEIEHKQNRYIEFHRIESESMAEIDEKVQALEEQEPWDDVLRGYNDAYERYINGDFDDTLVTKLYNSIEEVLQTICVDLEEWTDDRDRSHGYYLDLLNEHDVYDANGITAPELNQLLGSLEKMVSKVGNDRKQRHAYHDRAYCTLLIHQVGAYLYFLISRYDDYKN